MSNLSAWDNAASGNNSTSPDGFPEGMLPSGVNDSAREVMAAIRRWYEDASWINLGYSPVYVSGTQLTIAADVTTDFTVGRRVRAVVTAGTIYGTISASSFSSPDTTITVVWDSGSLDVGLSTFSISILPAAHSAVPHMESDASGITVQAAATFEDDLTVGGDLSVTGGVTLAAGGLSIVGDIVQTLSTTRAGYLNLNGDSVGSASSGADNASADYADIYAYLWDNVADSEAPVAGGRGASAAADFAADKALIMPDARGRFLLGADNMGGSSADVVTDSEADTLGDVAGSEEVTQTTGTLVGHTHSYTAPSSQASQQVNPGTTTSVGSNTGSTGSGNALSTINPYLTVYTHIKY